MEAEFLKEWLQIVLNGLLAAAVPILLLAVRSWLAAKVAEFQSNLNQSQLQAYKFVAREMVLAAEQLHLDGKITDRKNWAVNKATEYLKSLGYSTVNVGMLGDMIESAIIEEFNKAKKELDVPDYLKPDEE